MFLTHLGFGYQNGPVQTNTGEFTHWMAIGRNITEQNQNKKVIKASFSEKENPLTEIHHRVKSNLLKIGAIFKQTFNRHDSKKGIGNVSMS